MVEHPLAESRRVDDARLRVEQPEGPCFANGDRAREDLPRKLRDLRFETIGEAADF
jgi:hypothetical protein